MDNSQQSQDLFDANDGDQSAETGDHDTIDLPLILKELRELKSVVNEIRQTQLKTERKMQFCIEVASCKPRFQTYLKQQFSISPWLNEGDEQLKEEIIKCLRNEGFYNDAHALKGMVTYASKQYTEFRSKLKKIVLDGFKRNFKTLSLRELCAMLFKRYAPRSLVCSQDRLRSTIIIRRFMYSYNNNGSMFYEDLKKFWIAILDGQNEEKWRKLEESDARRAARARDAIENEL